MVRKLRLYSGLVLFFYLFTHLLNHSLGAVSLEALESGREWFLGFWRLLPSTVALYGALLIHLGLAFWAVSGMWTAPERHESYALRFIYWSLAFLPGFAALLISASRED